MSEAGESLIQIRSYRPDDAKACKALYSDGLIGGKLAENDTAYDMEEIESAYMKNSGSHFWVAKAPDGQVVGMIGVQQHDPSVGEIRRLRVAVSHRRRGIGFQLIETALKFCLERQYLKVKLDTFMDEHAAVKLFEKFRFLHEHTKTLGDRQLMYFYLDFYSSGPAEAT